MDCPLFPSLAHRIDSFFFFWGCASIAADGRLVREWTYGLYLWSLNGCHRPEHRRTQVTREDDFDTVGFSDRAEEDKLKGVKSSDLLLLRVRACVRAGFFWMVK